MRIGLRERLLQIDLLVLDVDGVLTDGAITYTETGDHVKSFHVRDGSGLKLWHKAGKQSAIITGRRSKAVERRAAELGIAHVWQGAGQKADCLAELIERTGCPTERIAAIGDDVPDLPLFARVGASFAVADGCPDALAAADTILVTPGGRGAAREAIEVILRAQGLWADLLQRELV